MTDMRVAAPAALLLLLSVVFLLAGVAAKKGKARGRAARTPIESPAEAQRGKRTKFQDWASVTLEELFEAEYTGRGALDWRQEVEEACMTETDWMDMRKRVNWTQNANYLTGLKWFHKYVVQLPEDHPDKNLIAHPPAKVARVMDYVFKDASERGNKNCEETVQHAMKAADKLRRIQKGVPVGADLLSSHTCVKDVLIRVHADRFQALNDTSIDPQRGGYETSTIKPSEQMLILQKGIPLAAAQMDWQAFGAALRMNLYVTYMVSTGMRFDDSKDLYFSLLGLPDPMNTRPFAMQMVTATLHGGKGNREGYAEYRSVVPDVSPLRDAQGWLADNILFTIHILQLNIVGSIAAGDVDWQKWCILGLNATDVTKGISYGRFYDMFVKALRSVGIEKEAALHLARNTFIAAAARDGAPLEKIKLMAGHDTSATARAYLPKSPEASADVAAIAAGWGQDFRKNFRPGRTVVKVPHAWVDALFPGARTTLAAQQAVAQPADCRVSFLKAALYLGEVWWQVLQFLL